jgi:glycosyltransferase involved in cell wall biosynthesis
MRFSVIIPNYNYGDFVGRAIDSALALDWPDVEVIVVDDGSTDHSAAVIRSYGDKIIARFQTNATQRVACNDGFAASTGEMINFLDSDDMLAPSVAREAAAVWGRQVSKVQFQMMRVDAKGLRLNSVFPAFRPMPTPEKLRDWNARGLAMPTPPGSGNVYARWFLERIFPLDDSCGTFSDSACLVAAPLFGDVVTVAKPLVSYRVHERNDSRLDDDSRFAREIIRAAARLNFAERFQKNNDPEKSEAIFNSIEVLQFRVASMKLRPDIHPLPGDNMIKAMKDAIRLFFESSSSRLNLRGAVLVWSFLTLLSPRSLGRKLVALRYK